MAERALQRILLADDDLDIREVVCLALARLGGFTVEACESGEEALRRAPEFKPDLVLLDAVMPGRDGPATLRALRSLPETADTPVVFLTARTSIAEKAQFEALGSAGVITKPFDPLELPRLVRNLWSRGGG